MSRGVSFAARGFVSVGIAAMLALFAQSAAATDNIAYQDSDGNLVVMGSNNRNTVSVNSNKPDKTTVTLNGRPAGTFNIADPSRRIIIFTFGDVDNIQITGAKNADIYAGEGNDVIYGGEGNDVIRGEGGNDFINGRFGHDVVMGGEGADTLSGASGNDFLIGGDTTRGYDDLYADLSAWSVAPSQATLDAIIASYPVSEAIVDDLAVDRLTGDAGQDAMVYSTGAFGDVLPDFLAGTDFQKIVP